MLATRRIALGRDTAILTTVLRMTNTGSVVTGPMARTVGLTAELHLEIAGLPDPAWVAHAFTETTDALFATIVSASLRQPSTDQSRAVRTRPTLLTVAYMNILSLGVSGLSTEASEGAAVETCTIVKFVLTVSQGDIALLIEHLVSSLDTNSTLLTLVPRSADALRAMETDTIGFAMGSTVSLDSTVGTREPNVTITLTIHTGTVPFAIGRTTDGAAQGAVVTTVARETHTFHIFAETMVAAIVATTRQATGDESSTVGTSEAWLTGTLALHTNPVVHTRTFGTRRAGDLFLAMVTGEARLAATLGGDADPTVLTHTIIIDTAHLPLEPREAETLALATDTIAATSLPFAESFHLRAIFTRELASAMASTKEANPMVGTVIQAAIVWQAFFAIFAGETWVTHALVILAHTLVMTFLQALLLSLAVIPLVTKITETEIELADPALVTTGTAGAGRARAVFTSETWLTETGGGDRMTEPITGTHLAFKGWTGILYIATRTPPALITSAVATNTGTLS